MGHRVGGFIKQSSARSGGSKEFGFKPHRSILFSCDSGINISVIKSQPLKLINKKQKEIISPIFFNYLPEWFLLFQIHGLKQPLQS